MKLTPRDYNIQLMIVVIIAIIAVVVISIFGGCSNSDNTSNPTLDNTQQFLQDLHDTQNTQHTEEVERQEHTFDATFLQRVMQDRPDLPEIIAKGIKIDPDDEGKPLPQTIINVDGEKLFDKSIVEIEQHLGQPIDTIQGNDDKASIRYYNIFDDGAAEILFYNDEIINLTLYYRRGYPQSVDALKAAGFQEAQLTLTRSTPAKRINKGVSIAALDTYSAQTDNRIYQHISVSQTTKTKVWYTVTIQ